MRILVGSGRFGGKASVNPKGKPKVTGRYFVRRSFSSLQHLGQQLSRGNVDLVLLSADADNRDDRHACP